MMKKYGKQEWGNDIISHGTSVSRGLTILIPKNIKIDLNILSTKKDTQGWILIIECKLEEKKYILVNIYAPTKDKPNEHISFLSKLREMLQNCNGNPLIIGGDFNTCLNIIQDM